MKRKYIIPIFVPHLGCPNALYFVIRKALVGKAKK